MLYEAVYCFLSRSLANTACSMMNRNSRKAETTLGTVPPSRVSSPLKLTMLLIVAHHYVVNSGLTAPDGPVMIAPTSASSLFLLLFGAASIVTESLRYDRYLSVSFVGLQQIAAACMLALGVALAVKRSGRKSPPPGRRRSSAGTGTAGSSWTS